MLTFVVQYKLIMVIHYRRLILTLFLGVHIGKWKRVVNRIVLMIKVKTNKIFVARVSSIILNQNKCLF